MSKQKISTRELTMISSLATVSALLQLVHIGYQSPQFGMWIDFVACSWIIAFFLFGIRGALLTSLISAIIMTLFAPETWLGASMKWSLSLPILLCLHFWLVVTRKDAMSYSNPRALVIPVIIALLVRAALALLLNYYYAIPIWLGIPSTQAITTIPWYVISLFNLAQGLCDIILAWIITFRFKIIKFKNSHFETP